MYRTAPALGDHQAGGELLVVHPRRRARVGIGIAVALLSPLAVGLAGAAVTEPGFGISLVTFVALGVIALLVVAATRVEGPRRIALCDNGIVVNGDREVSFWPWSSVDSVSVFNRYGGFAINCSVDDHREGATILVPADKRALDVTLERAKVEPSDERGVYRRPRS